MGTFTGAGPAFCFKPDVRHDISETGKTSSLNLRAAGEFRRLHFSGDLAVQQSR
jgi:hypothetical protein